MVLLPVKGKISRRLRVKRKVNLSAYTSVHNWLSIKNILKTNYSEKRDNNYYASRNSLFHPCIYMQTNIGLNQNSKKWRSSTFAVARYSLLYL
jgi:hypothetical protein